MMSNYRDIIKAPIITEKSADLAQNHNTYTFSVDVNANKTQIKQAIEKIFNVKVLNVLESLKANRKTLIVVEELTENLILATRNLENVVLIDADEINTLDVVSADNMIITEAAVKRIEEVLI